MVADIPGLNRSDEIGQLAQAANIFKKTNDTTKTLLHESKLLAHDLAEQEKALRKSNEELDNFAYVASHDLKSPLRAIHNLADLIEEDCEDLLPDSSKKHLTLLRSRISRMEALLSDILRYSRAGRVDSKIKTIDIHEAVNEALQLVDIPENFTFHITKPLPTITTRTSPFIQVLQNLFSNAIKYNDKEHGEVWVRTTEPSIHSNLIEIEMCDNGMGIPEEFHERIFQMFQTLHARDQFESSGMGLAIVKRVLENEGGKIRVQCRPEGGTCFTVA